MMSFDGSSSPFIEPNSVYIGDYLTSQASATTTYPYMNFITHVNFTLPGGSTPTGPAMWDAFNYFTQRPPQYGSSLTPMTGSTDQWKNPFFNCTSSGCLLYTCAKNYILLMSDGDWNAPGNTIGSSPTCTVTTTASESNDPLVPAYCMHRFNGYNNSMGTMTSSDDVPFRLNDVYTVGLFLQSTDLGYEAMQNISMYGSFDNETKTWPGNKTGFPSNTTCSDSSATQEAGAFARPYLPSSSDWDIDGNNVPDNFFSASDAYQIKQDLMDAVQDMVSHVTSGTAASVLASGEGSGANLVQATYYPRRRFFDASIDWIGGLQNLWYFVDPKFASSNILEDTDQDRVLDLNDDNRAVFLL